MDETTIKKTEDFINSNKQYINKLYCCYSEYYKQLDHFEFLPGHKSIILAIPNQIKEYKNKNIEKRRNMGRKETPSLLSNEVLRGKLIKNLMVYSKEHGSKSGFQMPDNVISEANIHDFESESNGNEFLCKCRFSCPFCTKTFSVIYKKFWMTSNVTKHLKMHMNQQ